MRIKTFEAPSLKEAYHRIGREFDGRGCTTSVLSTRTLSRGGVLGFFGTRAVQVTVAIDDSAAGAPPACAVPEAAEPVVPLSPDTPREETPGDPDGEKLRDSSGRVFPPALIELHGYLRRQEVDKDLAEYIVRTIAKRLDEGARNDKTLVMKALEDSLTRIINVSGPIELVEKNLKIIAFVGPTGVGKTTTIAKLASDFTFVRKKKVTLITLDTFRIGAVEQLRTYSHIMNIPLEVAHDPQELKIKLKEHADSDLIMIDTPGRSPRDDFYLSELKNYLDAIAPVEVHLVLSANTPHHEIRAIVDKYGHLNVNRLVLTKMDEVFTFGSIVNIMDMITLPISYVTNGQNVPRDIDVADAARLAHTVTGSGGLLNNLPGF